MANESFKSSPETEAAYNKAFAPPQPSAPAEVAPKADASPINVFNPDGDLVSIPSHQLQSAVSIGYRPASEEEVNRHVKEQKFGTLGQQAITGLEGAAQAATFGLSTGLERAAGVAPEDIQARREVNPGTHMLGQVAGLLGSSVVAPEAGAAALLGKAGEAVAPIVEGAGAVSKIGSATVRGAIENMVFQGGDEVSKMLASDPNQSVETAAADIGLAGLIGGGISGGVGAVSPLWKATMGGKLGGLLKAISDKAGGVEGVVPDAMNNAIAKSGMDLAPEIRAGLSSDPQIQQMFKTLEQSDTTSSGLKLQEANKEFRKQANQTIINSLGKTPEEIEGMELSKYETGKNIGKTLAQEYETQIEPIAKKFDELKNKYSEVPLLETTPDQSGTVASIAEKIGKLAQTEGWSASPSSEIMSEVNRVLKELPAQKNVRDLGNYIKAIGDNMQSDPMNGPLRRAGSLIKNVLKEAEADVIGAKLGAEEGEAALGQYKQVRQAYAKQAQLQEALDSRLHAKGSTSGYAKSLREMANTDGESLLRRLSGTNDADLLNLLKDKFPATAQALKDYHINNVLKTAADKAKPGDSISAKALRTAIDKMSPELRNFAIPQESLAKINAVGELLDQFSIPAHNFSNTARTMDKLLKYVPGSAIGMATMLMGHSPGTAAVVGALTGIIGKEVPDAVRLSLLKFLGSTSPIESEGFKSMVGLVNSTIKGENLMSRGAKNLFKAGKEVLPQSLLPSEQDRKRLDKAIKTAQQDPNAVFSIGGKTGHYLPEHTTAMTQVAVNGVQYLNNLRPNSAKASPLDNSLPPSSSQTSAYNRALDIAQQPLILLDKIKQGTLTPQDTAALKAIYPNLYTRLSQKLSNEMIEAVNKGESIPYKTRLGLSLFLGQALDSTMAPSAIIAAQPQASQGPQMAPQQGEQHPKHSMTALNKLPGSYQTPGQAREQHKITKG